jgi:hypothetical protein
MIKAKRLPSGHPLQSLGGLIALFCIGQILLHISRFDFASFRLMDIRSHDGNTGLMK